jgi:hypothetical protein
VEELWKTETDGEARFSDDPLQVERLAEQKNGEQLGKKRFEDLTGQSSQAIFLYET